MYIYIYIILYNGVVDLVYTDIVNKELLHIPRMAASLTANKTKVNFCPHKPRQVGRLRLLQIDVTGEKDIRHSYSEKIGLRVQLAKCSDY